MNENYIPTILSAITAIAAIVAPVVTAIITARSNLKIRKTELFENRIQPAVEKLADSYAAMHGSMNNNYYWSFCSAAHCLIGLLDSKAIKQQILDLLVEVRKKHGHPTTQEDEMMDAIMTSLSKHLILK